MRYFFFGSLMDADILSLVLGRTVPSSRTRPASLHGYQRFRVRGECFPMLQPTPGGQVHGILVDGLGRADAARIAWFEDRDYEIDKVKVTQDDGRIVSARACLPTERLAHEGEAWEFPAWQTLEKTAFLPLADEWMALYGRLAEAEQQNAWAALKSRLQAEPERQLSAR